MSPRDRRGALTPAQRRRLDAGEHAAVAAELRAARDPATAGWLFEQIWDFSGALSAYLAAGLAIDALRVALELDDPQALGSALAALAGDAEGDRPAAIALLQRHGRHLEAAHLLTDTPEEVTARAAALRRGGDPVGAARALADAGRLAEALAALGPLDASLSPATRALAARLSWSLGDAETAARQAQRAIRQGYHASDRPEVLRLLGRALTALGHDLAAQIATRELTEAGDGAASPELPLPGRYLVQRTLPVSLAGAAYAGLDRVTLREVELHLLFAEHQEAAIGRELRAAVDRFAQRAEAAAHLDHPAIRPILHVDRDAGLLILPHAEGPPLSALIRPPGMAREPTRARGLLAFLVRGLAAAHQRGLVHGSLFPSQIVCDAAGRPLLGPFGADALVGLAATRTDGLAELLTFLAPECRRGQPPTTASDIYGVGALFAALLSGEVGGDPAMIAGVERAIITAATAEVPADRPSAAELLRMLELHHADLRQLQRRPQATSSSATDDPEPTPSSNLPGGGERVVVGGGWSAPLLDALIACDHPWIQPILDRGDPDKDTPPALIVASWPPGCRRPAAGERPPAAAHDALRRGTSPELAQALVTRADPASWRITPDGGWMLSLSDLLPAAYGATQVRVPTSSSTNVETNSS